MPDGQGSISPMLVVVLRVVRPPPGPCGQPSTWQPPVEGLWSHGCGRHSSPGWSQVVGPQWFNAPSRRLRGYGRPAGWVSQSEELAGPYPKVAAAGIPTLYRPDSTGYDGDAPDGTDTAAVTEPSRADPGIDTYTYRYNT